jgi:hypothetical protein
MVSPQLRSTILALACLAPMAASADEPLVFGNPPRFCRNGAFPGGGEYAGPRPVFQLGQVLGQGETPIPFLGDDDGSAAGGDCPRADNPRCKRPNTARPGDRLIVSKTWRGYACVWKRPKQDTLGRGQGMVGWLPLNRVAIMTPNPNPPLHHWLGRWSAGGEPLILRRGRTPHHIRVEGMAYWPGRQHPNAHSGRLFGSAAPTGNTLVIEDLADPEAVRCRATLTLVGDVLMVNDNHRCGGLNVNFDGVYQRQKESSSRNQKSTETFDHNSDFGELIGRPSP